MLISEPCSSETESNGALELDAVGALDAAWAVEITPGVSGTTLSTSVAPSAAAQRTSSRLSANRERRSRFGGRSGIGGDPLGGHAQELGQPDRGAARLSRELQVVGETGHQRETTTVFSRA
jgi:hypothetical protein